jgi:hypothetical protein
MTQIILNIEDKAMVPSLRKILSNLKGVSIAKSVNVSRGSMPKAVEEVRKGRLTRAVSVSDLMEKLDS